MKSTQMEAIFEQMHFLHKEMWGKLAVMNIDTNIRLNEKKRLFYAICADRDFDKVIKGLETSNV